MTQPTDLSDLLAWWDADQGRFDATSGGSPVSADGAIIKGWAPRAGSVSNRLTQSTEANCPKWDATRELVVTEIGNGISQGFESTGITVDNENFSFFVIWEMPAQLAGSYAFILDTAGGTLNPHMGGAPPAVKFYNGSFTVSDVTPYNQLHMIGIVCGPSSIKVYLNGNYSTVTDLPGTSTFTEFLNSAALTQPMPASVKDVIFTGSALSDANVTNILVPYAQSRGVVTALTSQVLMAGDSITAGMGSTLNRGWPQRMMLGASVRMRSIAISGISLADLASGASANIDPLIVSGQTNICVIWAGTNDIALGATGAATYTVLSSMVAARQSAGWDGIVVVTPLPRNSTTIDGEYAAYRTLILANTAGADAVSDPIGDATIAAGWEDGSLTNDYIHPNDAGYALIAPINQAAIESLLGTTYFDSMSGGASLSGSASSNQRFFPNAVFSAGAILDGEATIDVSNESEIIDQEQVSPRPRITFQVKLIDYSHILSFPQPDSLNNVAFLKQSLTIEIPGVDTPLKDGDQFTLFGKEAIQAKDAYQEFLTVLAIE